MSRATAKQRVLKKWPEAMCWGWADGCVVYTHGTNTPLNVNEAIGFGANEIAAWADADRRINAARATEGKHG